MLVIPIRRRTSLQTITPHASPFSPAPQTEDSHFILLTPEAMVRCLLPDQPFQRVVDAFVVELAL